MPFASAKQERFMFAEHPDIARRWASEFGSYKGGRSFKPSPSSESHEVNKPGVPRAPRIPGPSRDFSHLMPSQSARHVPKGPRPNEKEAMQESRVTTVHGSRHSEMSLESPRTHSTLRAAGRMA